MKEVRYPTLGKLTLPTLIYDSIEEADTAAGKVGAVLESANDNWHYRGSAATGRDIITEFLEEETNIERQSEPLKNKDGSPKLDKEGNQVFQYTEKQTKYVDRVCQAKGWTTEAGEPDLSQFQSKIDELCRNLPGENGTVSALAVDSKARERKPTAPKKLAAKYLEGAKRIVAGTKWDKFVKDAEKFLGVETVDKPEASDEKGMEKLGWTLKAVLEAKEKQQLEQY